MLEKNFVEVYDKFKLNFYRRIFELVREREGSLSAMEAFSLEVIKMLDEPTVGQFADFLNISQVERLHIRSTALYARGLS